MENQRSSSSNSCRLLSPKNLLLFLCFASSYLVFSLLFSLRHGRPLQLPFASVADAPAPVPVLAGNWASRRSPAAVEAEKAVLGRGTSSGEGLAGQDFAGAGKHAIASLGSAVAVKEATPQGQDADRLWKSSIPDGLNLEGGCRCIGRETGANQVCGRC